METRIGGRSRLLAGYVQIANVGAVAAHARKNQPTRGDRMPPSVRRKRGRPIDLLAVRTEVYQFSTGDRKFPAHSVRLTL